MGGVSAGVHLSFTLVFFLMVFIFLLKFTKSDKPRKCRTKEKNARNRVYWICVAGMLVGGSACALTKIGGWQHSGEVMWQPLRYGVLIGETIAIWSFAVAWFVKGGTILQDESGTRVGHPPARCCATKPEGRSTKKPVGGS